MRPLTLPLAGSLLLAALCGCDDDRVLRTVVLGPQPALPSGSSSIVGAQVRVSAENLEPLRPASRYVAWLMTTSGKVALGELKAGQPLVVNAVERQLPLDSATEIRVTEENAATELPSAPSTRLRLRGPIGAPLLLDGVADSALSASGGEALLDDGRLTLRTSGLPTPPVGLSYAAWGRFAPAPDCTGPAVPVLLGSLDASGSLVAEFPYLLATLQEVFVTLESERGDPETASPSRLLRGELVLTPQEGGAESAPHTH